MRDVDARRFNMLQQACWFGERRRKALARGPVGALFGALTDHAAAIARARVDERNGRGDSRNATSMKANARRALLAQLEAIRATARAATKRRDASPHFAKLRRPRDADLLSAARSIANDVAPNEALLVEHHLAPTFLADLHAAIATFEGALGAREPGRQRHMAARAGMQRALAAAGEILRQLDAVLPNVLDNASLLVWRRLRRVRQRRGRPRKRRVAH